MECISLIGECLKVPLETKYGFAVSFEDIEKNIIRLTNQLWKLIPMKENNEDWQKQLNTVIIEIAGMNEVFVTDDFASQFL